MAFYDGNGNKIEIESSGSVTVVNSTEHSMPVHDTTVKLYKLDSATTQAGGIVDNSHGFAVSAFYEIPKGYTGKICAVFKVSDAQKSVAHFPLQTYLDDNYVTYWSAGVLYTTDGVERQQSLYWEEGGAINKVRFTIAIDYVDDCYAYLPQDGKILFAGKNTIYYGMSNRNGYTVVDENSVAPYSGGTKMNILQGRLASENFGMDDEYVSVVEEAKNAWMMAHNGDPRKIPLILHTDQHGRLTTESKGLPRLLSSIVPWRMYQRS